MRWCWFPPQDTAALYHTAVAFGESARVCARVCVRACALRSMCVCVCSQLYWHFLKRGWHFQGIWRLDPFCVWRAVCCPPRSTEGNAAAEPAACPAFGALVYSIWSSPSSSTRSVIRKRPALYIACLLEMTGSLLGLFLSLAVFPWGLECFCFSQLRQKSYNQKIWEKKVEIVWEGVRGRENKNVWWREGEIRFSCYRLVSGANWHRLTSLFHGDWVKKSLATLCPLFSLTRTLSPSSASLLLTLWAAQPSLSPLLSLTTLRLPCLAFSAWMDCAAVLS